MNLTIDVELKLIDDEDVLVFYLTEERSNDCSIKLNSATAQQEIKKVFSALLKLLVENEIELNYIVSDDYTRGLYRDVCREYVNELQKEIKNVKMSILKVIE